MDRLEEFVFSYLQTLGLGEVKYEPEDPGTFPDFSVGGKVAVEATRLVKPLESGGGNALETILPSVRATLRNVIEGVAQVDFEVSRFVDLGITFPLDKQSAAKRLREFLSEFAVNPTREIAGARIHPSLVVDVYRAGGAFATPFCSGMITSPQFSGWVVSDLLEQCENAVTKKETRLSTLPKHYSEAWLAVGSHLTTGLSQDSFESFSQMFDMNTRFDALVLIDENNPARSARIPLD